LFTHGNLKPGETVLLQGSGGVSLFALQLAVARGARVLITSRSPAKIAHLQQLGAAEVIDTSTNAAWDEVVLRSPMAGVPTISLMSSEGTLYLDPFRQQRGEGMLL
jgi:NADPH:quinone reductase-like Zn-dependent oxidoreductase